jgi:transcriptional regulator with XRE-family HTH domain
VSEDVTAGARLRRRIWRLYRFSRLTQAAIGQALGLQQTDVSRRLHGKSPWRIEELDGLARLFKLTVPELFFDEYGRWDRRKAKHDRRSGVDRRQFDRFQLREDPQPWHGYRRRLLPPPPPDEPDDRDT